MELLAIVKSLDTSQVTKNTATAGISNEYQG
jgi:hypothetical protein